MFPQSTGGGGGGQVETYILPGEKGSGSSFVVHESHTLKGL